MFFPPKGDRGKEAKAVCATCPVIEPCYEAGKDEDFGIWGGATYNERAKAQKRKANGHIRVRGCWLCGQPTQGRDHYCSENCRADARRAASRRSWHKRQVTS